MSYSVVGDAVSLVVKHSTRVARNPTCGTHYTKLSFGSEICRDQGWTSDTVIDEAHEFYINTYGSVDMYSQINSCSIAAASGFIQGIEHIC